MRRMLAAALIAGLWLLPVTLRSDDPVSSSITFNKEVIRIFERKCLQCHTASGVAMSLATYHEARPWSRAIREELIEQRMPPWSAAPGYTPLANGASLTQREMTMLLTWLDGGVPRGEESNLPRPKHSHAHSVAAPDHVLQLPVQSVPANDEHVVRRFTVTLDAAAPRRVQRIQVRPGNQRLVRGAFVSIATPAGARWLSAWTPWHNETVTPEGSAFVLPSGTTFEIEMHYRGRETELQDRSTVALFAATDAPGEARHLVIELPAGAAAPAQPVRGSVKLRDPQHIWAILPMAAAANVPAEAGSIEVTARLPDQAVQVLLWVPHYRADWPTPYVLRDPVLLPAGTVITATATAMPATPVTLMTSPAAPRTSSATPHRP